MLDTRTASVQLFDALARLRLERARGDAGAASRTAVEVGGCVAQLATAAGNERRPGRRAGPPPRPVAEALARALFASPHLSRTLAVATTSSDVVVFHPSPELSELLGLSVDSLEAIRAEVDLDVADALKRIRILHFLWQHAGNPRVAPDPLWNALFPGVAEPRAHHFAHRGARLYAVVPQRVPPPPEALFLRWLPGSERWTCIPDSHFDARWVDTATIRGCARAVGASEDEIVRQLDTLVCAVPQHDEAAFLLRDQWRAEGWADLSGLGRAWPRSEWLTLPLAADAIAPDGWLVPTAEGLEVRGARRVFDGHALSRLTTLAHGLHAEVLARLLAGRPLDAAEQAWLFDLDPYVQRVLQPLLDWTAEPAVHAHLAERLGIDPAHVAAAMVQVHATWLAAARGSWGGVPSAERRHTVPSIVATHLAVLQASLHHAHRAAPDPRAPHGCVLLLFVATWLARAPLGRLWRGPDGGVPPPEDVVGEHFETLWPQLLDAAFSD